MRITALLQKIHELASQAEHATAIDIDLMLDYTRVLYSDLLEWRDAYRGSQPLRDAVAAQAAGAEQAPVAMNTMAPPQPAVPVQPAIPEPAAAQVPAEPTLEEYMALHAGAAIHRERTALPDLFTAHPDDDEEEEDDEVDEQESPAAQVVATAPQVSPPVERPAPAPQPVPVAAMPAPPPPPVRDIRSMIGINDKYQIMSELFGNDKAAYEQALDMINRAESEQAAFNWLRERLWVTEDHSDAAMIFFDVVRRFKNA